MSQSQIVMVIGTTGAGKTTLIQHLLYGKAHYKKTQSVEYIKNFIDTPGEYIELPHFYRAIIVTSYDADKIVFVQAANEQNSIFPPNFASLFTKEVIGVVTKIDMGGDLERAKKHLTQAGAGAIFVVDYNDETTLTKLEEYLFGKEEE